MKHLTMIGIFALLSFPMFYYSYKFGSPDTSGQRDFYDYYPLYSEMDVQNTEAPYNMRLLSTSMVYLLGKTGVYFPVEINFKNPDVKQQVYFQAIIVHFIAAFLTSYLIYLTLMKLQTSLLISVLGAMLYLLQYGTVFWGAGGITDGFSAMMFAVFIYFFLLRQLWAIPLMFLFVFQRELLILGGGIVSFMYLLREYLKNKNFDRYYSMIFGGSLMAFLTFSILRNTLFYTPKNSHHFEITSYFGKFSQVDFSLMEYLKGTILSQNLLMVLMILILYKIAKGFRVDRFNMLVILTVFVFFHLIRAAINPAFFQVGRHVYMLSSLFIVYLGLELNSLLSNPHFYSVLLGKSSLKQRVD